MKIEIAKNQAFSDWLSELNDKEEAQVAARPRRIEEYGHLGDAKHLEDGLCELRWKNR